ncbi:glycosyltransferase [Winogradskyella maritima]|uniref:Glycosyltransferase n=1 Tax=Winogradskyella maritima TaxID=1517766 RepID=A0ABV8AIR9_9FLAO|nr:glycosyltransferase [Winogradskyella maritima]
MGNHKLIDSPMVSVSILTYQHKKFIEKCLNSVLSQKTNFTFEIVIGEDESIDGTRELCLKYAKKHPDKIRLILRNRKQVIYIDGKPTGRYNFIENLRACRGKYIALCEGDDFWIDKYKLQKQVDFLENNEDYVMTCHNSIVVNEKNEILSDSRLSKDRMIDFSSEELKEGRQIITNTMCFRNILSDFPQIFSRVPGGDTFLVALLGEFGKSKFQNEIENSAYRIHGGGLWNSKSNIDKLNALSKSYLLMSKYFKSRKEQVPSKKLFGKYFNVERSIIDHNIQFKIKLKLFFRVLIVSKECFIHSEYRKILTINRFLLVRIVKSLSAN